MKVTAAPLHGTWIIEPRVFGDHRGYFFESFNRQTFALATGIDADFLQDNQSMSGYGVLRGLHFQKGDHAQAKLVRVLSGEVLDVVVDLRRSSPTFGQHFSILLSGDNHKQVYIPRGMAHGFVVLSTQAEFFYKCDNYYAPQHEGGIHYNDPALKIDWMVPADKHIVSDKDKHLPLLAQSDFFF
jgi:dTDP-4-dehydrorhamnose 3,5-epimerase